MRNIKLNVIRIVLLTTIMATVIYVDNHFQNKIDELAITLNKTASHE